jgi:hypothetical protein
MPAPRDIVLYKYYPAERLQNLENLRLYFSKASVFNDPFETTPYFVPSLQARIFEKIGTPSVALSAPREQILDAIRGELQQNELAKEIYERNLVFSASDDGEHILLWSHYADGHKGFAVGFKASHEKFWRRLDGVPRNLRRVNYSYLRPEIGTVDEFAEQEMLLTKSSHWQYEREWRMFESAFNSDDDEPVREHVWGFRLEPDTVERVVLGSRMLPTERERAMKVLEQPHFRHVTVVQAVLDEEEFAIRHKLLREPTK